jgi:uncharacterized protein YkwD
LIRVNRIVGIAVLLGISAASLSLAVAPNASAGDPLLAPDRVCPDPALSAPARPQIAAMLCYHAYARRRLGVPVLRSSAPLNRSAALKMHWIVACRDFAHTPCGHPFVLAFSSVNYTRGNWRAGENLAWGSGAIGRVREIFDRWLQSPAHRQNISRPDWREIGVSFVHTIRLFGWENVTVWVTHFGTR